MLHTFMTSCLHNALVLVFHWLLSVNSLLFDPPCMLNIDFKCLPIPCTSPGLPQPYSWTLRSADTTVSYLCTRMPVTSWLFSCAIVGFFALTLLVGRQEEHSACKNWVMRCWCGYLSGARCRLLAFGPADAIAIPKPHRLLPHLNLDRFCLSGTGLPRLSWKRGR